MAKRKRARQADGPDFGDEAPRPEPEKRGRKAKEKTAAEQKPPADPFGDMLANYADRGSPADGNWKPSGDPETDLATLESQERALRSMMNLRKAERDMAKAEAKLAMAQAEQTSITDGFKIEEKRRLHLKADAAERKAAKTDKDYKRSRGGWANIIDCIHRYLTDKERPLFDKGKKPPAADKTAA